MGRLFGTDGVRGIANKSLTPELAFRIGRAGAYVLSKGEKGRILIGSDTRHSKDLLEAALVAGVTSAGIDVVTLGVVPTPAVSLLTRREDALGGIVISASHNPAEYNGIKFFGSDGYKLGDSIEKEIEDLLIDGMDKISRPIGNQIGSKEEIKDGYRQYIDYLKTTIDCDFKGLKVGLDCGNGAVYKAAPIIMEELGAKVHVIHNKPDGMNINRECGSTCIDEIKNLVLREKLDIGLSFDGDADRLIAVDENGKVMNGDHIMAVCASHLKDKGKLKDRVVVATVMSNMGLDDYLNSQGIRLIRTRVGDKYVIEEMKKANYLLGGEQSGHLIFLEHNTTGDGLLAGLQLMEVMKEENKKMSELNHLMKDYDQVLVNARVKEEFKHSYMEDPEISQAIDRVEERFDGKGRVLIRPSGTEPLVRVMIESKGGEDIEAIAKELADFIEEKLA